MLYVVGFGPGNFSEMTFAAEKAVSKSEIIVGYTVYTELMRDIFPEKKFVSTGMRKERERVEYSLKKAAEGKTVSLICSGDSGVYGMASLVLEMSVDYPDVKIEIVCGVTAAISGAAVLGSPITSDFAVVSLSDLLTPWYKIEKRIECAAMGDFSIVIYNPSSVKRSDYLRKACDIILKYQNPDTICGYVRNIGRERQESGIMRLGDLKEFSADMFTTVFIGNSDTKNINGKMVTLRGYKNV